MAVPIPRRPPTPDSLDETLRGAREALERLRLTLAIPPLPEADPSRQTPEPGTSGGHRVRVRR